MIKYFIVPILMAAIFAGGYYVGQKGQKVKIKVIEKTKIVNKIIKQPVAIMEYIDAFDSPIKIDGWFLEKNNDWKDNWFHVEAKTEYKFAERDFKIKVGSSGNWKFYVGIGIIGAIAGAGIYYKIRK